MLDPISVSLKMQQTAITSAMCVGGMMAANWMRFMKGEHALFGPHMHKRSEEMHAHRGVAPTGVKWTDHYGKRSHDVDVEHMR